MRCNQRSLGRLPLGVALALLALPALPGLPPRACAAEAQVPPAVAALLPKSAALKSGDWGVFPTEFGKTFSGGLHAGFPGRPSSCDFTIGPELRVEIKGDTAWEEPPMLDMAVQLHESEIAQARTSLPARVANLRKTNSDVQSVGALKEERLPGATLLSVEYTENCARRPKGTDTVMLGFARKGATLLTFDLWMSAGAAETRALALEILEGFRKFDPAAVLGK